MIEPDRKPLAELLKKSLFKFILKVPVLEPVYLCLFFVLAIKIVHHKALLVQFGDPNKPVTTK